MHGRVDGYGGVGDGGVDGAGGVGDGGVHRGGSAADRRLDAAAAGDGVMDDRGGVLDRCGDCGSKVCELVHSGCGDVM